MDECTDGVIYRLSVDDGYGDAAYIGFRFVYAAATAAGSGIYSTTGAGGVILKYKISKQLFDSLYSNLME